MTVGGGTPKQGLLEVASPVVNLSRDLPQHKGLREEEGPRAQTATSRQ